MNRKLISKAIGDIDDSFIAETQSAPVEKSGHAPERTFNMGKYENKPNRFKAYAVIANVKIRQAARIRLIILLELTPFLLFSYLPMLEVLSGA